MSRKLTTYTQPSVRSRIEQAPDIEQLARIWRGLGRAAAAGKMRAEKKTLDRWTLAVWNRVGELVAAARTPEETTYIYNVVLRWPKAPEVARELEALMLRRVAALPSRRERWQREGIMLGGVAP